jgi:hypothetical protein
MTKLVITLAAAATACGAGAEATQNLDSPIEVQQRAEVPRSRAAFEAALARHDAAAPADRAALAAEVDRLAAQRYATVSRLYWHTDIAEATAEARERGVPVLSLRMLGDLREDYSCANSRFFRVALYANAEVSKFLRDSFALHWSSERRAPVVTVDYGDGRVMKRTLAGNSAHYVLDSRGRPVDVLPGLYGPKAFMAALRGAAGAAAEVGGLDGDERAARVVAFHQQRLERTASRSIVPLVSRGGRSIRDAERIAVTKARVELPILDATELARRIDSARGDDDNLFLLGRLEPVSLDARSRALIAELAPIDWARSEAARGEQLDALIAGFEKSIAIDTALNEHGLHDLVSRQLAGGAATLGFEEINRWVYETLFRTPASDPWLGMDATGSFTALPSSGVAGLGSRR